MEDVDTDGLIMEFEACPDDPVSVDSKMDLTPRRKPLTYSCMNLKDEEAWPFLVEYFGVAYAFAALGALIHNTRKVKNEMDITSSHVQKMALVSMLARAMGWLHILALNAQLLREKLSASEEARHRDGLSWKEEIAVLVHKKERSELEVFELKKRREEDSKANEKVVRIYAGQEQSWKSERKKLRHEINLLRKDLFKAEVGEICGFKLNTKGISCEMCDQKDKHAKQLELALSEKEFLLMTAIEEARLADREHKEIRERLAEAELVEVQLSKKLDKEVAASVEQDLLLSEVKENQMEVEGRFKSLLEELNTTRINLSTSNFELERILSETEYLKKELQKKDAAVSSLMEQARVKSDEMEDLVRKLAQLREEKKIAEVAGENWRWIPEETVCSRVMGAKVQSITQLEEIHWHEVESYERQLRVKDERISALRSKLLAVESALIHPKSQSHELKLEISAKNLNCTTLALYDDVKTAHDLTVDLENFNSTVNQVLMKLHQEFDEAKEKLRDQVLKYKTKLSKLRERTEAELQQKDLQLASTEAKLCQVLLQLAKTKRNEELITFDHSEEKIFLQYIGEDDQELLLTNNKGFEKSKTASQTSENLIPDDQKNEGEISFEGQLYKENMFLGFEFLEQKMVSKTEKNNSLDSVQLQNASRLQRYDSFSLTSDPRSLSSRGRIAEKTPQTSQYAIESSFATTAQVLKEGNDSESSRNLYWFRSSVKRKRESMNKTHDDFKADPICTSRTRDIDDFSPLVSNARNPFDYMIPVNRTQLTDADLPSASEHHSRNSLSTIKPGLQGPSSPVFSGMITKRTDVRTREDIEILGLALEVKRIDQQLAEMVKAGGVEQSDTVQFLIPTTMVVSTNTSQNTKRSQGLAGRVCRLAKHMGFTGPLPAAVINSCIDVNGICTQDPVKTKQNAYMISQSSELPSTNDLAILQWRAKVVSEKLLAIQTKLVKYNSSGSSLFPTEQLLDAVQAHLSQVKMALRARMRTINPEPSSSAPAKLEKVHSMTMNREKYKSRGAFGRGPEYRSSKYHLCRLDGEAHHLTRKAKTQTFLQKLVMQLH
ncbi:uncharacterized protein [Physcomitrium patens]|uniref:uncharacterized protein isoform X1 n=1 Tax=Physcomitrium patens TaxID=3218 RepID=UPI000D15D5B4|nr:uncharacterized protein LOC112284002 isoform X4 [Physcomitrium patens]|eukprot:XP_024379214.1 uncharacterized protein LOC112284002 isoform X4 [Physcomitrella patens]